MSVDDMRGEELRRAVAVEVMGWTLSEPRRFIGRETVYWVSGGDEVAIASGGSMVDTECGVDVFGPDTDWAAFGLVVERCEGWHPEMSYCDTTCCWYVHFNNLSGGDFGTASEDGLPTTFCRAALKAVRARG